MHTAASLHFLTMATLTSEMDQSEHNSPRSSPPPRATKDEPVNIEEFEGPLPNPLSILVGQELHQLERMQALMGDCDNFQVKTFAKQSLDSIVAAQRTEFQLAMNYKEHTRPLILMAGSFSVTTLTSSPTTFNPQPLASCTSHGRSKRSDTVSSTRKP